MYFRVLAVSLLVAALGTIAAAQGVRRAAPPVLRAPAPAGLVYVSQRIDLAQQIGVEGNIMTIDGEPMPRMQTTNVTLGLVIDDEGHIVTRLAGVTPDNPAQDVTVMPPRSRPIPARFIGIDVVTGLCVLKVDQASIKTPTFAQLPALPLQRNIRLFGFSPQQGQSQRVGFTLWPRIHEATGQIAKARSDFRYSASNPIYHLIRPQLTPVQDGSLITDSDGSVFGIAVYDTSGEGLNLVYPISRVRAIAHNVIEANTSIAHGWLGATGLDMPAIINPRNPQNQDERGVRVIAVWPDSPAWSAGVKQQDILLSVNERPINSAARLTSTLKQLPADSEVTLKVKRGSEYKTLKARLTPAPAVGAGQQLHAMVNQFETMKGQLHAMAPTDPRRKEIEPKVTTMAELLKGITGPSAPEIRLRVFYGLEVQPLTAQLAQHFGVSDGVLVSTVVENNKGTRAGLRAGDVITKVGDRAINDLVSLMEAFDESAGETVEITVARQREQLKLAFPR
jgi:serine protease Do